VAAASSRLLSLEEAFAAIDLDGDGRVTFDEVGTASTILVAVCSAGPLN
jgi:hypothetical protein